MKNLKIALYGYQTDAGKALIELFEDANLPISELYPLAYDCDPYEGISLLGKNYSIQDLEEFDFKSCNIFIFIGSKGDSQKLLPLAKKSGAIVIDASLNNYDEKTIVYTDALDDEELKDAIKEQHIVPMNSSATLIAQILQPLKNQLGLKRAVITLMEAVSGLGKDGAAELARETIALLNMHPVEPKLFNNQVAFNIHTQIGDFTSDGSTTHEEELLSQIGSVIGEIEEGISLTSIIVPVFYGHTATINFTLAEGTSIDKLREVLSSSNLISIVDNDEITPISHGVNESTLFISRIREDRNIPASFSLTAVIDNHRMGLASNCISILKRLLEQED